MKKINEKIISGIKKMCEEYPDEVLKALLETPCWPSTLKTRVGYTRYDDDTRLGNIVVMFGPDGDGWIEVISEKDPDEFCMMHRFRNYSGGGQSLRTHAALMFLAVAMDHDNRERPQNRK